MEVIIPINKEVGTCCGLHGDPEQTNKNRIVGHIKDSCYPQLLKDQKVPVKSFAIIRYSHMSCYGGTIKGTCDVLRSRVQACCGDPG